MRSRLSWRPKRLHRPEDIDQGPMLGDAPVLEALEVDAPKSRTAPGRCHTCKGSNVRARQGPSPGDRVALHQQVIDRDLDVGEGGTYGGGTCLEGLDAHGRSRATAIDHARGKQVVENVEAPLGNGIVGPASHQPVNVRSLHGTPPDRYDTGRTAGVPVRVGGWEWFIGEGAGGVARSVW